MPAPELNLLKLYRAHRDEIEALADERALFALAYLNHIGPTARAVLQSDLALNADDFAQVLSALTRAELVSDRGGALSVTRLGQHVLEEIGITGGSPPPPHKPPEPVKGSPTSGGFRWMFGGLVAIGLLAAGLFVLFNLISPAVGGHTISPPNTITPVATQTAVDTPAATNTPSATVSPADTFTPQPSPTQTPKGGGLITPATPAPKTPTRTIPAPLIPSRTFTPTATGTPNQPTTFSNRPFVSPNLFYGGGDTCPSSPRAVTISVIASDPSGISQMAIYFWLVDKKSGAKTNEPSLPMTYSSGSYLGENWQRQINSTDISHIVESTYWFQFYFLATDKTGAQTKSQTYRGLVTYKLCGYLR